MHDPVLNFLDFILPHSTQRSKKKEKKGRKKLITYLQTLTRTQNPRSSYFSFHSRIRAPYRPITTAAVSTTVETPPRTRRSRPSFFSPPKYQGHRPFEFNRFSPRKKKLAAAPPVSRTRSESFPCGKRVRGGQLGRAPHLDALPVLYPVHLNRLSLFLDARADGIDISVEKRDGGRGKGNKDGPWHRLRPRTNHVEWAVG